MSRSDDEALDRMIKSLADAVYDSLFDAWEATGNPAAFGTVLSLVMVRFIEAYADAAGMPAGERPAFFEKSINVHATAIRQALAIPKERPN